MICQFRDKISSSKSFNDRSYLSKARLCGLAVLLMALPVFLLMLSTAVRDTYVIKLC